MGTTFRVNIKNAYFVVEYGMKYYLLISQRGILRFKKVFRLDRIKDDLR